MYNISNQKLQELTSFYQELGVDSENFFVDKNLVNIFDFLNIIPEVDENGKRKLTPYEVLGIMPNIVNGKERPIIFFIKNKFRGLKISKVKLDLDFTYSEEINKKEESLIDIVLRNYKLAIMQNNLAEAERQYEVLDKITGGRAKHYVSTCYDYTKFYKQMKKQLLIDIFSHFFIVYMLKKKSLIKPGVVIRNKKYKMFSGLKNSKSENEQKTDESPSVINEIKSIKIEGVSNEQESDVEKSVDVDFGKQFNDFNKNNEIIDKVNNQVKASFENKIEVLPNKSFVKKRRKKFFSKRNKKDINKKINSNEAKDSMLIKVEKEVSYE